MGKRKTHGSKKSAVKTEKLEAVALTSDDAGIGDLRTAPPIVRVRAFVARLREGVNKVCVKLATWAEQNDVVADASTAAAELMNAFPALDETLEELETKGFSPPRTTYTASTEEGDTVSVLDKYREKYEDIMAPSEMGKLTVLKKHPGKGGGLIVENSHGAKMKVATSHVVKL
jgi:hypothetical protein